MGYSYSKVETHNGCPYKYKLRYIDRLEPIPDQSANNALYIGTAAHEGVETRSIDKAIESYTSHYNELTIDNEIEIYKLRCMLEKAIKQIPEGEYEFRVSHDDGFVGYIDMLVKVDENVYDLYDFKCSNNASKYRNSAQVHVYKYFYEKMTGNQIRDMYYVMIPKVPEVLNEDMNREQLEELVLKTYEKKDVKFEKVEFNRQLVNFFFARKTLMEKDSTFEKRYTTMCRYCEFQKYCSTNGKDTSELLKKEEVVEVQLF